MNFIYPYIIFCWFSCALLFQQSCVLLSELCSGFCEIGIINVVNVVIEVTLHGHVVFTCMIFASDIVCPFNLESILDRSNQQDLWFLVSVMSHILLGQTTCISLATCGMKWRPCLLSLLQSWVCISWIGCPSPSLLSLCIHVPLILLLISMQQSMGWSTPWNIRLYMISTDNPLRGSDEHRLQKRYLLFLVSQVVLVVQSRFLQIMFQRLREASAAGDALWFCVLDMVLCRGRISTCIEKLVRVCVPGVISSEDITLGTHTRTWLGTHNVVGEH